MKRDKSVIKYAFITIRFIKLLILYVVASIHQTGFHYIPYSAYPIVKTKLLLCSTKIKNNNNKLKFHKLHIFIATSPTQFDVKPIYPKK